jgi:hypothetical protein
LGRDETPEMDHNGRRSKFARFASSGADAVDEYADKKAMMDDRSWICVETHWRNADYIKNKRLDIG